MKGKKKASNVWDSDSRKSGYLYLEAEKYYNDYKFPEFHYLMKRAYELDTTNTAAAFRYGVSLFMITDMANIDKPLNLMKKHVVAHPEDYKENLIYSDLLSKLNRHEESEERFIDMVRRFPDKQELKSKLANEYITNGKYDEAIKLYDELENAVGFDQHVVIQKIKIYSIKHDTTNIINEATKFLNKYPQEVSSYALLGDIYLQLNKPDSAIAYYNKMEEIDPENGYIHLSKAAYYQYKNDIENYDKQIYKALINEQVPVDNKLSIMKSFITDRFYENDSSARVDTLFKALILQHPHEADIHRFYGRYLTVKKDFKQAAEEFSYVLDILPTSSEDWKSLMIIHIMNEDYPKAISSAEKALEFNPDSLDLYQYIAPVYAQIKEFDKSLETFNKALGIVDSTDVITKANIYGSMGDAYFLMTDTIKAFECYEKSLKLNPVNPLILNNYAYFLAVSDKDLDKAEKMSALAVKADPESSTFLDTYAWIYFKKREFKLAKMYMEKALDIDEEKTSDLYEHYGDILFMLGEPENAVKQWEEALKLNPESDLLQRKVKHKTYFYK